MPYRFIHENQSTYHVDEMCECLGLVRGGYYSWKNREPSNRSKQDEVLKDRIVELHRKAKGSIL